MISFFVFDSESPEDGDMKHVFVMRLYFVKRAGKTGKDNRPLGGFQYGREDYTDCSSISHRKNICTFLMVL